jgi:hypothetical protein
VAVSVTTVPGAKLALQVVAQAVIPSGSLLIVPAPAPAFVTVSVKRTGAAVKVAVTVWSPTIATTQGPVPVQPAPLQPVNVDAFVGVAVSVTVVPVAKSATHVPGQEMPLGLLVTVPVPFPARLTVS